MRLIIVGVDGNRPAEQAAGKAAELAHALGANLHVVCAYTREQVAEVEDGASTRRVSVAEESAKIAADVAARVTMDATRTTSGAVQGRAAEVLTQEADRLSADLIVVGNKRVQGMTRALGSIAGAVAQKATCDVYVAHTN